MSWSMLLIILTPTLLVLFIAFVAIQNKLDSNAIQVLLKEQRKENQEQRIRFDEHQIKSLKLIQDSLQQALKEIRNQVNNSLVQHTDELGKRIDIFTQYTQNKLKEISAEVDKQLMAGFEKTTTTFTDIVRRLTVIDEAQKKITELSNNVVDLQDILTDKRSRGAFGEVQLNSLIRNTIPETHFSLQHTLSNGKRVDCLLFLPKPTGNIAIDAKFPLETYRQLNNSTKTERHSLEQQFSNDMKKHISSITEKYIIPGETADGAVMFIPAEAIFAEIHSNYTDLVDIAHKARVWIVSPTTLMAILTTARAVLKDEATRRQVHIIQEHLITLSKDFDRFQTRMNNLARHIGQAYEDVEQVHKSSQKITNRFNKIEQAELNEPSEE